MKFVKEKIYFPYGNPKALEAAQQKLNAMKGKTK